MSHKGITLIAIFFFFLFKYEDHVIAREIQQSFHEKGRKLWR